MVHYEQVFGNVFERRESKCCAVLMKYCHKVKVEQVITLQKAQQLKTNNVNIVPGRLFCRQCKAKLLLKILTMNSLNVKNTKEKVSINWHFTCQLTRICENFK